MKRLLFSLAIFASAAQAQPAGWTIESKTNAQTPAAYKVVAIRTIGQAKLVYERAMLSGINLRVEQDGCSSGTSMSRDVDPAEHIRLTSAAMLEMVRDKDNYCKLSPAAVKGLGAGVSDAIAAADAVYERDRPTLAVAPRTATNEGWTIEDRPGEAYDGLVADHIFKMRKASGPILLTYTNTLPLYSERVSAGSRSIEGKVRDCDYGDSDSSEFVNPTARAGAVRKQIANGLETTGCEVTPAQVATALAGFDAAYAMLDGWAVERLDERRMLLEAAGSSDTMEMNAADAMSATVESAADAAGQAAKCAEADAKGWKTPPGC